MMARSPLLVPASPGSPDRAEPRYHLPRHDARDLTGGRAEAEIVLDGIIYRLRITKARKLILNKQPADTCSAPDNGRPRCPCDPNPA